jgi:hypothetical protein
MITLIIILGIILYINYLKEEKSRALYDQELKLKEQARNDYIAKQTQKENQDISFISETLNISIATSKEVYSYLLYIDKYEVFRYSETKKRQLELYKDFLEYKKNLENFINEINPIIEKEDLQNLDIKYLFDYRQDNLFTNYKDIPLREKLIQFNTYENTNEILLVDILRKYGYSFSCDQYISVSKEKSNLYSRDNIEILYDDLYKIIDIYNNHFNFLLSNTDKIILKNYDFFPASLTSGGWCEILKNLFYICVYESKIIPEHEQLKDIYNIDKCWWSFKFYCHHLFFSIPYYNIVDYKKHLLSNLQILIDYIKN